MRDHFELIDFVAYLLGFALILPALASERDNPWLLTALVVLVLPIPFYMARFRFAFPERIDTAFERSAYLMLFAGLVVLIGRLIMVVVKWAGA